MNEKTRSSYLRLGHELGRLTKQQRRILRRRRVLSAREERRAMKIWRRDERAKNRAKEAA